MVADPAPWPLGDGTPGTAQAPGDMGVVQLPEAPPPGSVPRPGPQRDARGKVCNRFCPVCQQAVHANKKGDWRCYGCGAAGGSFRGRRLYMTTVPDTEEGRAAAARLAAQW